MSVQACDNISTPQLQPYALVADRALHIGQTEQQVHFTGVPDPTWQIYPSLPADISSMHASQVIDDAAPGLCGLFGFVKHIQSQMWSSEHDMHTSAFEAPHFPAFWTAVVLFLHPPLFLLTHVFPPPPSCSQAYAAARMAESTLLGMSGEPNVYECAYVSSDVSVGWVWA